MLYEGILPSYTWVEQNKLHKIPIFDISIFCVAASGPAPYSCVGKSNYWHDCKLMYVLIYWVLFGSNLVGIFRGQGCKKSQIWQICRISSKEKGKDKVKAMNNFAASMERKHWHFTQFVRQFFGGEQNRKFYFLSVFTEAFDWHPLNEYPIESFSIYWVTISLVFSG